MHLPVLLVTTIADSYRLSLMVTVSLRTDENRIDECRLGECAETSAG